MMCALHVRRARCSPLIGCDMGRAERESRKTFKQGTCTRAGREGDSECEAKARVTREDRRKQEIGVVVVEA